MVQSLAWGCQAASWLELGGILRTLVGALDYIPGGPPYWCCSCSHFRDVVLGQSEFWFPHVGNGGGSTCLLIGLLRLSDKMAQVSAF